MKKFVLIVLLFFSAMANAQSVMGIKFGSSYEEVKQQLEQRLGKYSVVEKQGMLHIWDFNMGSFHFDFGDFYFQYNGDNSYFNEAVFQCYSNGNDVDAMKARRDYLYSFIKEKYRYERLGEYINEQGFKCYKFGINPFDETKARGLITLERAKSNSGEDNLYLMLYYLPIYYIDKSSDF